MGPPGTRDEDWFTPLSAIQYPSILKYGRRRLDDPDASVELAQEVFVVAWRRRTEVPDRSLPWLYGVARRLLANHWRARRAAPELLSMTDPDRFRDPGTPGPDTGPEIADRRAAPATPSGIDHEILRLIGWEELTVAEAAGVLGCSRATAAVRLHRARRRLTDAMAARAVPPVPRPSRVRS